MLLFDIVFICYAWSVWFGLLRCLWMVSFYMVFCVWFVVLLVFALFRFVVLRFGFTVCVYLLNLSLICAFCWSCLFDD